MKDSFGTEVKVGDTIDYAVSGRSGAIRLNRARVLEVRAHPSNPSWRSESLFVEVTHRSNKWQKKPRVALTSPTFAVVSS